VCIGILVHTALAALGVSAILHSSEALFFALKIAGAVYLVYLGARMLLTRESARLEAATASGHSLATLVWQGTLSNVTNPKIVLFFFAFLPQFVDPASTSPTRDLAFLGVLYALMALPIKAGVGLAAGSLSEHAMRSPRLLTWINKASGFVLVALGLRLAAQER
jgi:threonine/homoserine/homoserine lactone efflux protein